MGKNVLILPGGGVSELHYLGRGLSGATGGRRKL